MACHVDPVSTTTYRKDYKVDRFLPAIRMTTLPMYMPDREKSTNQWRPSLKKVPQPPSNLLIQRYEPGESRPAPPVTEKARQEVAGSTRRRVICTKFGNMDMAEIERLAHKLKWTPTTRVATTETHLPLPQTDTSPKTLEPQADMVRFDVHRYDVKPRMWQQAELFDRFQMREPVERVVYPYDKGRVVFPDEGGRPKKLPEKRDKGPLSPPNADIIRKLACTENIASKYVRQCPGYAGYVPQMPPHGPMTRCVGEDPRMISTMRATYRELPRKEYVSKQFSRNGSFSKVVTLTYPFNPYNKNAHRD